MQLANYLDIWMRIFILHDFIKNRFEQNKTAKTNKIAHKKTSCPRLHSIRERMHIEDYQQTSDRHHMSGDSCLFGEVAFGGCEACGTVFQCVLRHGLIEVTTVVLCLV